MDANYKNVAPSAVKLEHLTKRFRDHLAVDGVSLSVAKGETVAFLGPSGCGKTTLLRIIAGFEKPDAGKVYLNDENVGGLEPYERNIGLLFQQYALFPHMTVEQNIAYGLVRKGWSSEDRRKRVIEMLSLVRMQHMAKRWPMELSGGQQQRVALARSLAIQPDVILLDEPLSALDASLRHKLRRELKEILTAVSATVILVTHDQEEAMTFADRIIVLNSGKVEQVGPPSTLYDYPESKFVAGFLGRANWIDRVRLVERTADYDIGRSIKGTKIIAPLGSLEADVEKDICIRPECFDFVEPQTGLAAGILDGSVSDVIHTGADMEIIVETAQGAMSCLRRVRDGKMPIKGETVRLTVNPAALIVVPSAGGIEPAGRAVLGDAA